MKHYVVTSGVAPEDYYIVAVCSDRTVAERIADRINKESYIDYGDGEGYISDKCCIEEYEDGEVLFDEAGN